MKKLKTIRIAIVGVCILLAINLVAMGALQLVHKEPEETKPAMETHIEDPVQNDTETEPATEKSTMGRTESEQRLTKIVGNRTDGIVYDYGTVTYFEDGQKAEETFFFPNRKPWYKIIYEYNSDESLASTTTIGFEDGTAYAEYSRTDYYEDGKMICADLTLYQNNKVTQITRDTYDACGNVIESEYFDEKGQPQGKSWTKNTYDQYDNLLSSKQTFGGTTGGYLTECVYRYDTAGRIVFKKTTNYAWSDTLVAGKNTKIDHTITETYQYDLHGNVTAYIYRSDIPGDPVWKSQYTYWDDGRCKNWKEYYDDELIAEYDYVYEE